MYQSMLLAQLAFWNILYLKVCEKKKIFLLHIFYYIYLYIQYSFHYASLRIYVVGPGHDTLN